MPPKKGFKNRKSKQSKQQQPATECGGWFSIRGILDERTVRRKLEYLVDWDNDVVTGEPYEPTWVPASDVAADSVQEWKQKQSAASSSKAPPNSEQAPAQIAPEVREGPVNEEDSQSPRAPNFRRSTNKLKRPRSSSDDKGRDNNDDRDQGQRYKRRRNETASPSVEPVPSITSSVTWDTAREDTPAGEEGKAPQIAVEIPKNTALDASEYLSARESQSTAAASSQLLSELESQDQRIAIAFDSQDTIPDSQDLSSLTAATTQRQETQQNLQSAADQQRQETQSSQLPAAIADSQDPRSRVSYPESYDAKDKLSSSGPEEIIPASTGVEQDIPSRQPERYRSIDSQGCPAETQRRPSTIADLLNPAEDTTEATGLSSNSTSAPAGQGQDSHKSTLGPLNTKFNTVFASPAAMSDQQKASPSTAAQLQALWDQSAAPVAPDEIHDDSIAAAELNLSEARTQESHERPAQNISEFFTQPPDPLPNTSISHSTLSDNVELKPSTEKRYLTDALRDIMHQAFDTPMGLSEEPLMPPPAQEMQGTVSPADVSKPGEMERTLALLPSISENFSSGTIGPSDNSLTMAQITQPPADDSSEIFEQQPKTFMVTLPFQSSMRPLYDETLLKYKAHVIAFGNAFTGDEFEPPSPELVTSIDELFNRLQNLCDYPEDIVGTRIEELPLREKIKYALDANAKFSFVYELLQGITKDLRVLIIASETLLRPLVELVEFSELHCVCDEIGHKPNEAFASSEPRVTVAQPDAADAMQFDVVIGYDNSINGSTALTNLLKQDLGQQPTVLRLLTAYSIEHINVEIPENLTGLERKNLLLYSITKTREVLDDPPPMPEPHKVAELFAEYLNGETDRIHWEPEEIPEVMMDAYFNSQPVPSDTPLVETDNERKRKLDEEDEEEDAETKRLRRFSRAGPVAEADIPPLSEAVRDLLNRAGYKDTQTYTAQLPVPLKVLENVVALVAEAERAAEANDVEERYNKVINQLQVRVNEYESSIEKIYESNRSALEDRSQFETDARKARQALQTKEEENVRAEERRAVERVELEAKIARLIEDSTSNGGATQKQLQEKTDEVAALKKRLEYSESTQNYTREQYQRATDTINEMRPEIEELKKKNEDLAHKASDNLRHIHEVQAKNTTRELLRQNAELETQLHEAHIELDRVREELRQLKNGRRETRGGSAAPRSPRMGLMSPRAPARQAASGNVSRGGSPAPLFGGFEPGTPVNIAPGTAGMQFTTPQGGNGRWNPLS